MGEVVCQEVNYHYHGNNISMDDITSVISSSAVVRAMKRVNLDYQPTDKEKLDSILEHPELLARAVGMIVNNKTDTEIAKAMDIQPFTVGFIRENEFVRALCDECFKESIDNIKNGLSKTTMNAVTSLSNLVDPEKDVSEKVRYMASTAVINTVLKLNGELKDGGGKNTTVNQIQINNNIPADAKEAYDRAIRDMQSIIPVAQTVFENGGGMVDDSDDEDTEE